MITAISLSSCVREVPVPEKTETTSIPTHSLTRVVPTIEPTVEPTITPAVLTETPIVPTATATVTPTPEKISLEGVYTVTIQSEGLTNWYRQFFKELEVKWCPGCTTPEEVDELLEFGDKWIAVQNDRILYVHSGWLIKTGMEFGEILLAIYNSNELEDTTICLDEDICLYVVDVYYLDRDRVGESISVNEIFDVEYGDYFVLTCATRIVPGIETPKLVVQLRLLN